MTNKKKAAEEHNKKYQQYIEYHEALEFMRYAGLKERKWYLNEEYKLAHEIMEAEGLEPRVKEKQPRGKLSNIQFVAAMMMIGGIGR